jgi:glycosyltransferase involved in cell wall biosynthesis
VEAMALSKPIVTTPVGAEGTGMMHETHALIANSPESFAAAIVRLLKDKNLAVRLGGKARLLAASDFEISQATGKLIKFYQSL